MRKINAKPATPAKPITVTSAQLLSEQAAARSKPAVILGAAAAASASAGRSNVTPPAKPATAKADTPAKPSGNVTRTAATIVKQAANFATLSDRDTAYIAFYAAYAKRSGNGSVSIADIHTSGKRPLYAGSNKPHDAGVIIRLTKAGYLKPASDGTGFAFTDTGKTLKAYSAT